MIKTKGDLALCILIAAFFGLLGYFYGVGATYDGYTKKTFEHFRQVFTYNRANKSTLFQVGPFWFEKHEPRNPYLYSVTLFDPSIAGIESTTRKKK